VRKPPALAGRGHQRAVTAEEYLGPMKGRGALGKIRALGCRQHGGRRDLLPEHPNRAMGVDSAEELRHRRGALRRLGLRWEWTAPPPPRGMGAPPVGQQ